MSLSSVIRASSADLSGLVGAFGAVAERSFFAFAEPADSVASETAMTEWLGGEPYVATVSFRGPRSGAVSIVVPETLARELTSAFLGLDFESEAEVEETAVCDLVGEMANMATGSWLSSLEAEQVFELAHPEVSRAQGNSERGPWAVVLVNGTPTGLCCEFTGGRS
ncbi:MAG TPA: chemotaxis protein CheX [Vicinamibacterales bacterium]|nr:chemotaxis protein CheX [Vicinamibacterales bacterium]